VDIAVHLIPLAGAKKQDRQHSLNIVLLKETPVYMGQQRKLFFLMPSEPKSKPGYSCLEDVYP
jgi:hypothetical protein